MALDREKFLALALALAGCAKQPHTTAVDEFGMPIAADPYSDPECTGFGYTDEAELCVAWRGGRVKAGWVPTAECARWDDAGRCTANLFQKR